MKNILNAIIKNKATTLPALGLLGTGLLHLIGVQISSDVTTNINLFLGSIIGLLAASGVEKN